eukprot:1051455-Amphidinium_carterae.1
MVSGRSCCTAVHIRDAVVWPHEVIRECCEKLSVPTTGSEELLSGSEAVPSNALLPEWPGLQGCGHWTDYQLVVSKRARQVGDADRTAFERPVMLLVAVAALSLPSLEVPLQRSFKLLRLVEILRMHDQNPPHKAWEARKDQERQW